MLKESSLCNNSCILRVRLQNFLPKDLSYEEAVAVGGGLHDEPDGVVVSQMVDAENLHGRKLKPHDRLVVNVVANHVLTLQYKHHLCDYLVVIVHSFFCFEIYRF